MSEKLCTFTLMIIYKDPDEYSFKVPGSAILTMTELLKSLEGQDIPDETYYVVYPTEKHKEVDSRGWIPGCEVKALIQWSKEFNKKMNDLILWGK